MTDVAARRGFWRLLPARVSCLEFSGPGQESGESEVSERMLADAARVAGLDFTEEERREMIATVNENLANYEKTRAVDLPFTVVPPLYFNPVVPGTSPVSPRSFAKSSASRGVSAERPRRDRLLACDPSRRARRVAPGELAGSSPSSTSND